MVTEFEVQKGFWEVHTALDGSQINQSNRETQSCYTIKRNIKQESGSLWTQRVQFGLLSLFPLSVNHSHYF